MSTHRNKDGNKTLECLLSNKDGNKTLECLLIEIRMGIRH